MERLDGINIQFPISRDILSGQKTVETRTYPIPKKYLNKRLLLVETPGKTEKFRARCIAIIIFKSCFKYKNKNEFYDDFPRHKVSPGSQWEWGEKSKFGWELEVIEKIAHPFEVEARGYIYRKDIPVPL